MNSLQLSRLEGMVATAILEEFPDLLIVPQARVIKRTKKTRYEIDLYLPELFLGFEIQDFATHSRIDTLEKHHWGKKMKGPTYHEMKRRLALEQLSVTVVDIWQDEIESGNFKEPIFTLIQKSVDIRLPLV